MQQRYYDPVAGRFLSIDPVVTDANSGTSFNRYAYANNSPYKYLDADGRIAKLVVSAVKLAIKGGDIGSTVSGIVENVATIASPTASLGQKAMAVADIALDVTTGVNAKDIKAGVAVAGKVADAAKDTSKVFSKEKQALVDMAKADKKDGATRGDMKAYEELNKGLNDPFPGNKVRTDEGHLRGAPHSRVPHGHVGPVDHITITDP